MNLFINFASRSLEWEIEYVFRMLKSNVSQIFLDTKSIRIDSVSLDGKKIEHKIKDIPEHVENLGQQLILTLPQSYKPNDNFKIKIQCSTIYSEEATTALNWLGPEQTVGKKHPFLFTQSEPILCRTLFPCQDTPHIKTTFNISIRLSQNLQVHVTGLKGNEQLASGSRIVDFEQNIPIPSYLFAIVAGNLEEKDVSDRCSVFTEPEEIQRCSDELEDLENYVK